VLTDNAALMRRYLEAMQAGRAGAALADLP